MSEVAVEVIALCRRRVGYVPGRCRAGQRLRVRSMPDGRLRLRGVLLAVFGDMSCVLLARLFRLQKNGTVPLRVTAWGMLHVFWSPWRGAVTVHVRFVTRSATNAVYIVVDSLPRSVMLGIFRPCWLADVTPDFCTISISLADLGLTLRFFWSPRPASLRPLMDLSYRDTFIPCGSSWPPVLTQPSR